ncbi:unnamed protein product [Acanthoscelides obtectus]|uniref:Uncharacterized protein n=1 Tax=Acanthoscelides obtectus TaxID=200917 RepID=A0A9P0P8C4_ACAOB|nr:unnamed protein product [Acanthoscelides obtectus]CAK1632316.1 hypothetical protein AOBTE_LOCUS7476 [Acanthoscelides obtectus]
MIPSRGQKILDLIKKDKSADAHKSPAKRVPLQMLNVKKLEKPTIKDGSYLMDCSSNQQPPTYLLANETSTIRDDSIWTSISLDNTQFCQSFASQCEKSPTCDNRCILASIPALNKNVGGMTHTLSVEVLDIQKENTLPSASYTSSVAEYQPRRQQSKMDVLFPVH